MSIADGRGDDGRDYHGELIADELIESRISQRKTFGPPTAALGPCVDGSGLARTFFT
jgi:hypothetical protein